MLLARWAMTGEEEGTAEVKILNEANEVMHLSQEREAEARGEVQGRGSWNLRACLRARHTYSSSIRLRAKGLSPCGIIWISWSLLLG